MDSDDSVLCSNRHKIFMGDSSSSSTSSCGGWDSNQQKRQRSGVSSEDLTCSNVDNALESDALGEAQNSAEPDAEVSNCNLYDACDDYYEDEDGDEDGDGDEDEDENEYYDYNDMIDNDYNDGLAAKFDDMDLPPGVEATVPWLGKLATESQRTDKDIVLEEDIDVRYKAFKQFDTVEDYSDHHYANENMDVKKSQKDWMKKIQQEWKILENDLPGVMNGI